MLYAILCCDSEAVVGSWTKKQDASAITKLDVVQEKLVRGGPLRATGDHRGDPSRAERAGRYSKSSGAMEKRASPSTMRLPSPSLR